MSKRTLLALLSFTLLGSACSMLSRSQTQAVQTGRTSVNVEP